MVDRLEMQTKDLTEINIQKIAEIFPSCVTETKTDNGKTRLAVDFESLKRQLSDAVIPEGKERYIITWPGKSEAQRLANSPTTLTLRPCPDKSSNFANTKNIYIEGDNLDALKLLRETYFGKVKLIYIDPPYNTGNDFVYNDRFESTEEEYSQISGDYDDSGYRLIVNSRSKGQYHTDWLNMIYPRLILARDFLTEDGAIFISIDDNEQANLKRICDEIFGERNFIANICHKSRGSVSNDRIISENHNYVLFYAKNESVLFSKRKEIGDDPDLTGFNQTDENGPYKLVPVDGPGGAKKGNPFYEFLGIEGYWRFSKETMKQKYEEGLIVKTNNNLQQKYYLTDAKKSRKTVTTWWEDGFLTSSATSELSKLMGEKTFDNPKNVNLLVRIVKMMTHFDKEALVMDFFGGSSTTAHALFKVNQEDDGRRQFILIQLPEKCESKTDAYQAGYRNICELGEERIRRIGKQLTLQKTLNNNNLDVGFRVFRIDSSNMNDVFYDPAATKKEILDYAAENIKSDRSGQDLLIQVMLELDIELSANIQEEKIAGKTVFTVGGDYLIACFDSDVDDGLVTEIAKRQPRFAVFRDSSMSSDSVAINFGEIFKTFSPNTQTKVL